MSQQGASEETSEEPREYCPLCPSSPFEEKQSWKRKEECGCTGDGPFCDEFLLPKEEGVHVWHCHGPDRVHGFFTLSPDQIKEYTRPGDWPRVCVFFIVDNPDFYDSFSAFTCYAEPDGRCVTTATASDYACSGLAGSLMGEAPESGKRKAPNGPYHVDDDE